MRIKKNDNVMIVKGEHSGQSGKVIKIFPGKGRAVVEGRNLIKKHTRPTQKDPKGGIVEKEAPIAASSLMLVCPKCSVPTKTGTKILDSRKKVRTCKRCGEMIES